MSGKHATNHEEDENGCCHDDKKFWQYEEDGLYFDQKWCDGRVNAGKEYQLVDIMCYLCGWSFIKESSTYIGCDM